MTNTVSFPKLGWTFDLNPVAFNLFGLDISWYGVIIAVGVALAVIVGLVKSKEAGLDSDRVIDVIIVGFIGGIIGARLYYVAFKFSEFKNDLMSIFDLRSGGLAVYGGLILAVVFGLIMCRIRKVKPAPMLDVAAIGFLLGQGIGRWGNFVNVEAYGSPTTLPWGMSSEKITSELAGKYAVPATGELMVHPTFLYESLWCLLGFVLLMLFFKRRKYDGQVFLLYCTWYGVERFFVEGLRTDSLYIGIFRVSQLLSGLIVIVAVTLMIIAAVNHYNPPLYVTTDESKALLAARKSKKDDTQDEGGQDDMDTLGLNDSDEDKVSILQEENQTEPEPGADDEIGEDEKFETDTVNFEGDETNNGENN